MWLMTKFGFFSVVCGLTDCPRCGGAGSLITESVKCGRCGGSGLVRSHGMLIVRARKREHLEQLIESAKTVNFDSITSSAGTDYPYRTKIKRSDFQRLMTLLAESVDYDNFKDAAAAEHPDDMEYRRFLHATWDAGVRMEDERKSLEEML